MALITTTPAASGISKTEIEDGKVPAGILQPVFASTIALGSLSKPWTPSTRAAIYYIDQTGGPGSIGGIIKPGTLCEDGKPMPSAFAVICGGLPGSSLAFQNEEVLAEVAADERIHTTTGEAVVLHLNKVESFFYNGALERWQNEGVGGEIVLTELRDYTSAVPGNRPGEVFLGGQGALGRTAVLSGGEEGTTVNTFRFAHGRKTWMPLVAAFQGSGAEEFKSEQAKPKTPLALVHVAPTAGEFAFKVLNEDEIEVTLGAGPGAYEAVFVRVI
jgi:hypothetical protein